MGSGGNLAMIGLQKFLGALWIFFGAQDVLYVFYGDRCSILWGAPKNKMFYIVSFLGNFRDVAGEMYRCTMSPMIWSRR